jgi:hypothetical protein
MTKDFDTITVTELRALLHEILDLRPDISLRFRVLGSMWQPAFLHITDIFDQKVILRNPASAKVYVIDDINMVTQFELEDRFRTFQPNHHYSIKPGQ